MHSKLRKLNELVNFGADCLQKMPFAKYLPPWSAKGHLLMLMSGAHNYCESVCSLCQENRTQAAFVLLRPICEALIKSKYLYCNPRAHIWELRMEPLENKKKALDYFKNYCSSNKFLVREKDKTQFASNIASSLSSSAHEIKRCVQKLDRYGVKRNKGTLKKAEAVDNHNSQKTESLVYIYQLIYRPLSSKSHLDGGSFQSFLEFENDAISVLLSGDPNLVPNVADLASWLYENMLRQFLIVYRLPFIQKLNSMLLGT